MNADATVRRRERRAWWRAHPGARMLLLAFVVVPVTIAVVDNLTNLSDTARLVLLAVQASMVVGILVLSSKAERAVRTQHR